ncbi:hypothetical protein FGO68_gene6215 [Halteria grandinella]|uniref:Uncharacterized protein n=1 Tax=Halteria grandinella TaxID=5974 RepID=A0A8J8T9K6_HALGN|nr:hypothetical protein FGO68_gene6215 [Halteria grandinella]
MQNNLLRLQSPPARTMNYSKSEPPAEFFKETGARDGCSGGYQKQQAVKNYQQRTEKLSAQQLSNPSGRVFDRSEGQKQQQQQRMNNFSLPPQAYSNIIPQPSLRPGSVPRQIQNEMERGQQQMQLRLLLDDIMGTSGEEYLKYSSQIVVDVRAAVGGVGVPDQNEDLALPIVVTIEEEKEEKCMDESIQSVQESQEEQRQSSSESCDNSNSSSLQSLPSDDKASLEGERRLTHQIASNLMQIQPEFNKPQIFLKAAKLLNDKKLSDMGKLQRNQRLTLNNDICGKWKSSIVVNTGKAQAQHANIEAKSPPEIASTQFFTLNHQDKPSFGQIKSLNVKRCETKQGKDERSSSLLRQLSPLRPICYTSGYGNLEVEHQADTLGKNQNSAVRAHKSLRMVRCQQQAAHILPQNLTLRHENKSLPIAISVSRTSQSNNLHPLEHSRFQHYDKSSINGRVNKDLSGQSSYSNREGSYNLNSEKDSRNSSEQYDKAQEFLLKRQRCKSSHQVDRAYNHQFDSIRQYGQNTICQEKLAELKKPMRLSDLKKLKTGENVIHDLPLIGSDISSHFSDSESSNVSSKGNQDQNVEISNVGMASRRQRIVLDSAGSLATLNFNNFGSYNQKRDRSGEQLIATANSSRAQKLMARKTTLVVTSASNHVSPFRKNQPNPNQIRLPEVSAPPLGSLYNETSNRYSQKGYCASDQLLKLPVITNHNQNSSGDIKIIRLSQGLEEVKYQKDLEIKKENSLQHSSNPVMKGSLSHESDSQNDESFDQKDSSINKNEQTQQQMPLEYFVSFPKNIDGLRNKALDNQHGIPYQSGKQQHRHDLEFYEGQLNDLDASENFGRNNNQEDNNNGPKRPIASSYIQTSAAPGSFSGINHQLMSGNACQNIVEVIEDNQQEMKEKATFNFDANFNSLLPQLYPAAVNGKLLTKRSIPQQQQELIKEFQGEDEEDEDDLQLQQLLNECDDDGVRQFILGIRMPSSALDDNVEDIFRGFSAEPGLMWKFKKLLTSVKMDIIHSVCEEDNNSSHQQAQQSNRDNPIRVVQYSRNESSQITPHPNVSSSLLPDQHSIRIFFEKRKSSSGGGEKSIRFVFEQQQPNVSQKQINIANSTPGLLHIQPADSAQIININYSSRKGSALDAGVRSLHRPQHQQVEMARAQSIPVDASLFSSQEPVHNDAESVSSNEEKHQVSRYQKSMHGSMLFENKGSSRKGNTNPLNLSSDLNQFKKERPLAAPSLFKKKSAFISRSPLKSALHRPLTPFDYNEEWQEDSEPGCPPKQIQIEVQCLDQGESDNKSEQSLELEVNDDDDADQEQNHYGAPGENCVNESIRQQTEEEFDEHAVSAQQKIQKYNIRNLSLKKQATVGGCGFQGFASIMLGAPGVTNTGIIQYRNIFQSNANSMADNQLNNKFGRSQYQSPPRINLAGEQDQNGKGEEDVVGPSYRYNTFHN